MGLRYGQAKNMQFLADFVLLIILHAFVVECERICENEKIIKVTYAKDFFPEVGDEPLSLYDAKLCSMEASNNFNFLKTLENGFGAVTLPEDFTRFIKAKRSPIKIPNEELHEKFLKLFQLPENMILIQLYEPLRRSMPKTTSHTYWHNDFPGSWQSTFASGVCGFDPKDVSTEHWEMVHSFNIWIPFNAPFPMPLGFMDMETVAESQFRKDMYRSLGPPPDGTVNSIYYLPNLQVGQAYLFDNRNQIHGAFNDETVGRRRSIDQRFMILKAKSTWALDVASRGRQQFYVDTEFPQSRWVDMTTGELIEHNLPGCDSFRCALSAD